MLSLLIVFVIIDSCTHLCTEATLTPKSRKNDDLRLAKIKSGPQNLTVFDRSLVTETVVPKEILQNYQGYFREVDDFQFEGHVLGYVTPVC